MQYALGAVPQQQPTTDELLARFVTQDWPAFQKKMAADRRRMDAWMDMVDASMQALTIQAPGPDTTAASTQPAVPQINGPNPAHAPGPAAQVGTAAQQGPPTLFEVRACVQVPRAGDPPFADTDSLLWCLAWQNGTRAADGTPEWTVLRLQAPAGGGRGGCVRAAMRALDAFPAGEFARKVRLVRMRQMVLGVLGAARLAALERVAAGVRARSYGAWVKGVYHRAKEEGLFDLGVECEQVLFAGPLVGGE
ncbi:hypothetical protein PsYK624_154510 [Phanerochaete sordida]|uniref:Uncharacterized protein n=1 Tax=Phanerochaete sordida TaxID=48140 RepID=A0A9P3GPK5_9APHY|nr:hypothetical protein PsYK624_154510 [Phanerochaete sordida]